MRLRTNINAQSAGNTDSHIHIIDETRRYVYESIVALKDPRTDPYTGDSITCATF